METKVQKIKFKKTNTNKGITLVALVITIIVLLILAGVAINMAINSDGLFGKANEATQRWNEAVKKDEEAITNLTESWEQDKTTIKKGSTTLKVGDIVNYDETKKGTITGIKDVTWKVLGAENGNILLMSTTDVGTLTLNGKEGYTNGLQQLKDMCTPYGQGEKANGARNITIEDINRVTGYDVNKGFYDTSSETYKVYGYGTAYEYLKVNNYADRVLVGHYKGNDWKTGAAEIESNYYSYYPTTLTSKDTDPVIGLATTSEAYKMLFNNTNYYLNDRMVRCFDSYINYAFRVVNEAEVQKDYLLIIESASASQRGSAHGVRAVVALQSQVKLEKDKDGVWQIM